MKNILEEMYVQSSDILDEWMEKLFPSEPEGCINFGYWENIAFPLNIRKRISSQKNLYYEIFKCFDPSFKEFLEIGCGRGHGVFWLREKGYEAFGIDILENQIKKSQDTYPDLAKYLKIGSAEIIPFENLRFDCVYTLEAAQHFSSFNEFCKESFRVLKNNGKLVVSTYFLTDKKFFRSLEKIIPPDLEGFHNAQSIDDAINLIQTNGFIIKKPPSSIGQSVFPFYSAWQKQQLGNTALSSISEERIKWKDYYMGGGNEDHPWLRAFKKGWIDYFILEALKVEV